MLLQEVQHRLYETQSPPQNDMGTPTTSSSKEIQRHAIEKETYGNCFLRTCRCAWAHTTNQTCDGLCCYGWKVTHHPLFLQPVFSTSLDPLKRPGLQVICNKHQC